uniref:Uncharacterized protein n=1 Tax=Aegilops tauschii subsp. strangulata TaxID=200361 RepID=A0A452ZPI3_AEGTS
MDSACIGAACEHSYVSPAELSYMLLLQLFTYIHHPVILCSSSLAVRQHKIYPVSFRSAEHIHFVVLHRNVPCRRLHIRDCTFSLV